MYYIVYKTTNNINNKIYIGVHKTKKLNDGYIGNGIKSEKYAHYLYKKYNKSGVAISRLLYAVIKYGYNNFKTEILGFFKTYKDALKYESNLVTPEFVRREDTYNCVVGGGSHEHSKEQRKKISDRMRNNNPMKNPEYVKKMLKSREGYVITTETKNKISKAARIWCNEPKTRKLRSKNAVGKNNSSYDPTIFKFIHDTGAEFVGSCYDLFLHTNHKSKNNMWLMKKYINKRKWMGWRIVEKCQDCGAYERIPIKKI